MIEAQVILKDKMILNSFYSPELLFPNRLFVPDDEMLEAVIRNLEAYCVQEKINGEGDCSIKVRVFNDASKPHGMVIDVSDFRKYIIPTDK